MCMGEIHPDTNQTDSSLRGRFKSMEEVLESEEETREYNDPRAKFHHDFDEFMQMLDTLDPLDDLDEIGDWSWDIDEYMKRYVLHHLRT